MKFWQRFKKIYKNKSIRRRHPATSFLVETLAIIGIFWLSFYIPTLISQLNRPNLDHVTRAHYTIDELGLVDQILESIERWRHYYFISAQESADDSGDLSLFKLAFIIPIVVILFLFLTPILLVTYIIWFLYHYTWDLIMIAWGLFNYLGYYVYRYIIYLVGQISVLGRRLGKILPMNTSQPSFGDTMGNWRQTYIDPVILREQIAYLEAIQSFITRNIEPYYDQAMSPMMRIRAEWDFLWSIFINRTGRVLENTTHVWEDSAGKVYKKRQEYLEKQYKKLPKKTRNRFQQNPVHRVKERTSQLVESSSWSQLFALVVSLLLFVTAIIKFKGGFKGGFKGRLKWFSPPLILTTSFGIFGLANLI